MTQDMSDVPGPKYVQAGAKGLCPNSSSDETDQGYIPQSLPDTKY